LNAGGKKRPGKKKKIFSGEKKRRGGKPTPTAALYCRGPIVRGPPPTRFQRGGRRRTLSVSKRGNLDTKNSSRGGKVRQKIPERDRRLKRSGQRKKRGGGGGGGGGGGRKKELGGD